MKQAYHHKDLRNALVDEALVMLAESGQVNLTLRELARRLGVTHTAPYAHFADKKALLEGIADVGFGRLADVLETARDAQTDAVTSFVSMGLAYVAFARNESNLYRLMFADPELANDPECAMSPEADRAFNALVEGLTAIGIPPGADIQELAVGIWALVHGIAMLEIDRRISGKTMKSADDVLRLAANVVVRGLRPTAVP